MPKPFSLFCINNAYKYTSFAIRFAHSKSLASSRHILLLREEGERHLFARLLIRSINDIFYLVK